MDDATQIKYKLGVMRWRALSTHVLSGKTMFVRAGLT